jgi:phosphoribosylaminoimidazole carboxylase (NCAIR synthetase)
LLVDKLRQRKALAVAGLETPRWLPLRAEPTATALARLPDDFPWPAVLKPRTESGSRHTR